MGGCADFGLMERMREGREEEEGEEAKAETMGLWLQVRVKVHGYVYIYVVSNHAFFVANDNFKMEE